MRVTPSSNKTGLRKPLILLMTYDSHERCRFEFRPANGYPGSGFWLLLPASASCPELALHHDRRVSAVTVVYTEFRLHVIQTASGYRAEKLLKSRVMVETITFLFRFREVAVSDLGPEIDYPEIFHGFSQSFQAKTGILPYNQAMTNSCRTSPIHNSLITI
jgi:hypothetical protein